MTWVTLVDGTTADADELMSNLYHVGMDDLLPRGGSAFNATSSTYDIGSSAYRWNRAYINEIASTITFSSPVTFNSPSTFSNAQFSGVVTGSRNLLIAVNQQADGVGGGSCGSSYGYTLTSILSTLTVNYITGATLSSSTLTLPSGSYICSFSFYSLAAKCILWNNTASTTAAIGDVRQLSTKALFQEFTLATQSALIMKATKQGAGGATTTAMGYPTSFGEPEMYGYLVVYKI